jgi:O-antigen/teichoic acid export membrane protein
VRDYASFSLPLFGAGISGLIVVQGSLIAANAATGLAGIGAIGLAVGIAAFADRVDGIISEALYPAVCAVADRTETLYEVFVKSNRVALIWGLPFGVALALFADDLVALLFGERWSSSAGLIAAIGITAGIGQVAFNWGLFVRARGDTRPLLVGAVTDLAVCLVVTIPAILVLGLTGWALGMAAQLAGQLVVRSVYMRRLFPGFNILAQFARAAAPVVPGVALVLLGRLAFGGDRPVTRAIAELAVYLVLTAALTLLLERRLIAEVVDYVRRRTGGVAGVAAAQG